MSILAECAAVLLAIGLGLAVLRGIFWLVSPALAPVGRRASEIDMESDWERLVEGDGGEWTG